MHAVLVEVDIHDRSAGERELKEQVVPTISGAPGFVAGYWIAVEESKGLSVLVFDNEEHAGAASGAASAAAQNARGAVTITSVRTAPVVANA